MTSGSKAKGLRYIDHDGCLPPQVTGPYDEETSYLVARDEISGVCSRTSVEERPFFLGRLGLSEGSGAKDKLGSNAESLTQVSTIRELRPLHDTPPRWKGVREGIDKPCHILSLLAIAGARTR